MRCSWTYGAKENMVEYHDCEWGKPPKSEKAIIEMFCLIIFQAGLQWQLILDRRDIFRVAFCNFDIQQVSQFTEKDIERVFQIEKMIVNRRKTYAVIHNAQILQKLAKQQITLSSLIEECTDGKVVNNQWIKAEQIPDESGLSRELALKLKHLGFWFVGAKNMYAFLQAIGVINDHLVSCEFKNTQE